MNFLKGAEIFAIAAVIFMMVPAQAKDLRSFQYGDYTVQTSNSLEEEDTKVYRNKQLIWSSKDDTDNENKEYWGNAWFWMIYKDFLIFDEGVSAQRGVKIIDLRTRKTVYEGSANDHYFVENGTLIFDEELETFHGGMSENPNSASCIDAAKKAWPAVQKKYSPNFDSSEPIQCEVCTEWQSDMGTGFAAEVLFDLNAQKKYYTGRVTCDSRE